MSISIITACYNSLEFIENCIISLQKQKSIDLEHVLIDGDSKDGTKEFLSKINGITFLSEKDKGIYDALNKGVAIAKFDIIGILHTDDFFADEFVLRDIQKLFDEGADIVYADLEYVSRSRPDKIIRKWKSGVFNQMDLELGWMPPHPTFFARKKVFERVGSYSLEYKISGDYDLMLRAINHKDFKISYLPRTVVKMRVGGVSNRSLKNIILKMKEDHEIASRHFRFPLGTLISKSLRKIVQFK